MPAEATWQQEGGAVKNSGETPAVQSGELANVTTKPPETQALPQVLTELMVSHPWMPAGADEGNLRDDGTQERPEECHAQHGAPGGCSPGEGTSEVIDVSDDPGDSSDVELTSEDVSGNEWDVRDMGLTCEGVCRDIGDFRVAGPIC